MRKVVVLGIAAALVLVATAAASFTPAEGVYSGHLRNSRTEVKFNYFDHHVSGFETVLGHTHTHYITRVAVHDHAFSWTSPTHPSVHVAGKWTSSRGVSGTITNSAGVVHHWVAEKNPGFRALAAVTPRHGYYKAHLGGTRNLEFSYIAHNHVLHVFMIVHIDGGRWISSKHYPGTTYLRNNAEFHFLSVHDVNGPYLDVVGRWTTPEVVEGTVKEWNGARQNFRAHYIPPSGGGGPN
jgi:hypothetical protein